MYEIAEIIRNSGVVALEDGCEIGGISFLTSYKFGKQKEKNKEHIMIMGYTRC